MDPVSSPSGSSVSSSLHFALDVDEHASHARAYGPASIVSTSRNEEHGPDSAREVPAGPADTARPSAQADFNAQQYLLWHKRALLQRARVGHGRSHEMLRLYHFWVSFLQDGFNEPMYTSFKRYAEEDASAGHTYGLSCLFSFYLKSLTAEWDTELYSDFESLALKYQDYLDFHEGMECLAQLLAGPATASHPVRPPSSTGGAAAVSGRHSASSSQAGSTGGGATGSARAAAHAQAAQESGAGAKPSPATGQHGDSTGADGPPPASLSVPSVTECGSVGSTQVIPDAGVASVAGSGRSHSASRLAAPPLVVGPPWPGMPKGVTVAVDARVHEYMQLWHARRTTHLVCPHLAPLGSSAPAAHAGWAAHAHYDGALGARLSHGLRGEEVLCGDTLGTSLTGSSESGDLVSLLPPSGSYKGKHLPPFSGTAGGGGGAPRSARGRRISGGSGLPIQPHHQGHSLGVSPPVGLLSSASPPPGVGLLSGAEDLPALGVLRVGSAPGAGLPTTARIKRSRGRGTTGKRGSAGFPGASSGSLLGGVSPPLGSSPATGGWAPGMHAARGLQRAASASHVAPPPGGGRGRGGHRRGGLGAPGASGEGDGSGRAMGGSPACDRPAASGDPPLWEAQPCVVSCGAAAELVRALPLRLGELFGD